MKCSIFLLFICLLPFSITTAQEQNNSFSLDQLLNVSHYATQVGLRQKSSQKYKGSPYFTEWQQGYVILKSNARSQPLLLRYNMRQNTVEFPKNKKIYQISANKLNGFVIKTTDGNIIFKNGYKTDKKHINPNTLLRIIYNGQIKLLALHTSKLMKNLASYGTANTYNKFVNHTHYFLRTPDGSFHEIKLKKNNILDALPNKRNKVKNFAEQQNLNFKKEADLKEILSYYDKISPSTN